jgi:hypothetical protein
MAFTHVIQWRRKGYWSPGAKFSSEEEAQEYGEMRVNSDKEAGFRVVPLTKHGELSVEQCLVLLKCMHLSPKYWRAELVRFLEKGAKPTAGLTPEDVELLLVIGQQYPMRKLVKTNPEVMRNRLKMADARERAREIAKAASHIVALDTNPEVMPIAQGCFVQAWVFVPNRTEDQERGRQHDIAAYLAGTAGADAA